MRNTKWMLAFCGLVLAAVGCDRLPSPPRDSDGKRVSHLSYASSDPAETQLALKLEADRANYAYRLRVLEGYYDRGGNLDKLRWARTEAKALSNAWTFVVSGVGQVEPPAGESVANVDERSIAEYAHTARRQYEASLAAVIDYYETSNNEFRAALFRNVRDRFRPFYKYGYFKEAEVPGPELRPSAAIPAADELFAKAYRLYDQGKILPAVVDYNKEAQAVELFKQLVYTHQTSDKIAQAAFYIGEIYKEYFNQDVRALWWYERAWQWDPTITLPARFQAATIYDYRLERDAEALELYRQAVIHEQFNSSNVGWAQRRINDMTASPRQ